MRRLTIGLAVIVLIGMANLIWPASSSAANFDVSITDFTFTPTPLNVSVGDTVKWTSNAEFVYSVSSDTGVFDSGASCPVSGCMQPDDEFSFTFNSAGSFPYFCRIHGGPGGVGMSGVVVVSQAGTTTTTWPGHDDNNTGRHDHHDGGQRNDDNGPRNNDDRRGDQQSEHGRELGGRHPVLHRLINARLPGALSGDECVHLAERR